jgi:hypothetical protein
MACLAREGGHQWGIFQDFGASYYERHHIASLIISSSTANDLPRGGFSWIQDLNRRGQTKRPMKNAGFCLQSIGNGPEFLKHNAILLDFFLPDSFIAGLILYSGSFRKTPRPTVPQAKRAEVLSPPTCLPRDPFAERAGLYGAPTGLVDKKIQSSPYLLHLSFPEK